MIKSIVNSILALFMLMVSVSANSAIVYQADDRYIDHGIGGTFTPAAPYADFNKEWWAYEAGAFQNTVIGSTGMSGSGSTYAGFDAAGYGADANSVFSVSFEVDQLTDFSLTGSLDSNLYDSYVSVSLMENGVSLFSMDSNDLIDFYSPGVMLTPFSYAGQFDAGNRYQLILSSYSFDSDYYSEEWKFDLATTSVVPVPAALWLFGSGFILLAGVMKRKKV